MFIAICDDRREDARVLRAMLQAMLQGHRVCIFSDTAGLSAELEAGESRFDLYLLDIFMDGKAAGLELARQIRAVDEDADICFISSSDAFYREAYDMQDINYLLKPVSEEAFRQLMDRIIRRQERLRQQSFSYKWNGRLETVPYKEILFISSNAHILNIHCRDGSVRQCSAKVNDVEAMLDRNTFLRCHQSFLVNLYQVDHLSGSELILGTHRIPISRRYFPEVKRRYQDILFEEVD